MAIGRAGVNVRKTRKAQQQQATTIAATTAATATTPPSNATAPHTCLDEPGFGSRVSGGRSGYCVPPPVGFTSRSESPTVSVEFVSPCGGLERKTPLHHGPPTWLSDLGVGRELSRHRSPTMFAGTRRFRHEHRNFHPCVCPTASDSFRQLLTAFDSAESGRNDFKASLK